MGYLSLKGTCWRWGTPKCEFRGQQFFCLQEYIRQIEKNRLPSPAPSYHRNFATLGWMQSLRCVTVSPIWLFSDTCSSILLWVTLSHRYLLQQGGTLPMASFECCQEHTVETGFAQLATSAFMLFSLARTPATKASLRFAQSVAARKLCLPVAARTALLCSAQLCLWPSCALISCRHHQGRPGHGPCPSQAR